MSYKTDIENIFNKAVKDELSSAIQYVLQASKLKGAIESETADELLAHGKEEFDHFTQLIDYASKHGFDDNIKIELDFNVIDNITTDLTSAQQFNHKLEKDAARDYKNGAILAKNNNDPETKAFFSELMQDELKHFDDIAVLSGAVRGLNESTVVGKFLVKTENMSESANSNKLTKSIEKSIMMIDENMTIDDFAISVAEILKNSYGSHTYMRFLRTLKDNM